MWYWFYFFGYATVVALGCGFAAVYHNRALTEEK